MCSVPLYALHKEMGCDRLLNLDVKLSSCNLFSLLVPCEALNNKIRVVIKFKVPCQAIQ